MSTIKRGISPHFAAAQGILPLSLDCEEVIRVFSSVTGKQEAIDGFLQFSQDYFDTVACFSVRPDGVTMLGGVGSNIRTGALDQVLIPIDPISLFRRCIVNRMKHYGGIPAGVEDKAIFLQFLNGLTDQVFLYPGEVGDSVDILFYAEGPRGMGDLCISALETIIEKTVLSLKLLYIKRQLISGV